MIKIIILNNKKGFTIIETLIAIMIFSLSLTAIVIVASSGIKDMHLVKDKYIATYLAQEGIELVRYRRDNQYVATGMGGTSFASATSSLLTPCGTANLGCNIDSLTKSIVNCNPIETCIIRLSSTGYYNADSQNNISLPETSFTRVISIDTIGVSNTNGDEFHVSSVVTWKDGLLDHKVSVDENIFNWYR